MSRKALISFIMSVRLPVCIYQLGSHWTDIRQITCDIDLLQIIVVCCDIHTKHTNTL